MKTFCFFSLKNKGSREASKQADTIVHTRTTSYSCFVAKAAAVPDHVPFLTTKILEPTSFDVWPWAAIVWVRPCGGERRGRDQGKGSRGVFAKLR